MQRCEIENKAHPRAVCNAEDRRVTLFAAFIELSRHLQRFVYGLDSEHDLVSGCTVNKAVWRCSHVAKPRQ